MPWVVRYWPTDRRGHRSSAAREAEFADMERAVRFAAAIPAKYAVEVVER